MNAHISIYNILSCSELDHVKLCKLNPLNRKNLINKCGAEKIVRCFVTLHTYMYKRRFQTRPLMRYLKFINFCGFISNDVFTLEEFLPT